MSRFFNRSQRSNRDIDSIDFSKSACMFSQNGILEGIFNSIRNPNNPQNGRSQSYTDIEIGKPIVIRYLYHFLKLENNSNDHQEIMLSTYVKTEESKTAAAESINYYDPKMPFGNGEAEIVTYGGEVYGHELLYYSKSYTGESIKMTTKVMELDSSSDEVDAINSGIKSLGNIPFFTEYLPYVGMTSSVTTLLGKIFDLFNKDDKIIDALRLGLFFNRPNSPILRSGRYVCIQGKTEDEIKIMNLKLREDNKLVDQNDSEYKQTSYYVIQINSEMQSDYENFDYYQNAADMLSMTNREGNGTDTLKEFIQLAADGFKTYSDLETLDDMKSLELTLKITNDPELKQKYKAMYLTLSTEIQELYAERVKNFID